jgi:protein-disulfide isomerase
MSARSVRTAGRAAAAAAAAVLVTLAVTACDPLGAVTTDSDSKATPSSTVSATGGPELSDPAVLASIPAKLGSDGTTITVGNASAKNTVQVYEDLRCPICKSFETASGTTLVALAKSGKVRIQYTLASFLDGNLGGNGSKRAANALRASVEQGKFVAYHEALYANQPEESADGFTADFLLAIGSKIDGLRGTAFDAAVRKGTYDSFVQKSEKAFETSGAQGTPYVKINGKEVSSADAAKLHDPVQFAQLLKDYGVV